MTALGLILLVPVVMWLGQTVLLRRCGLPIRWRLDASEAPRIVRTGGRVVTQVSLVALLAAYPLVKGQTPWHYYSALLPLDESIRQFAHGAAASVLFLCGLFAVWIATDRVQIDVHQHRRRWMRRLVLLPGSAVFGAMVEELLFRGVVLASLLESFPTMTAIALGAAIFAAAHYVRSVKRYWTVGGHLMLGVLLCAAFVQTGTLWLPAGLHAGGIMMIMGARPFIRYRGPAWLTGASIFPFAGVVGIVGLGVLTTFVARYYGAPSP